MDNAVEKMKKYFAQFSAEHVTDIYLIIMLFLFPLFSGSQGYANITFSKFLFYLTATALWVIGLLICFVFRRADFKPLSGVQYIALAFLFVCTLSAIISPYFPTSILGAGRYDGLLSTFLYLMSFLGVSLFTRPKRIHIYAFAFGMTLCCLVGVLQLLRFNPLWLFPKGLSYYDKGILFSSAFLTTIGNTNILDAVLCLVIPLTAYFACKEKQYLLLLPSLLSLAIVLISGGSGAHLSLLACLAFAFFLLPRDSKTRRLHLVILLILAICICLAIYFWPGESGTLYEFREILHGNFDASFGSSRILIWRSCLELVPSHPLLGGGPGTLAYRLDIDFSRFVPETGQTLRSSVDNAHNIYLGYLVNTGLLGFLCYILLFAACLFSGIRRPEDPIVTALTLSAFCGMVHAFFGLGLCISEPFFWLILGLLSAAKHIEYPNIFPHITEVHYE